MQQVLDARNVLVEVGDVKTDQLFVNNDLFFNTYKNDYRIVTCLTEKKVNDSYEMLWCYHRISPTLVVKTLVTVWNNKYGIDFKRDYPANEIFSLNNGSTNE